MVPIRTANTILVCALTVLLLGEETLEGFDTQLPRAAMERYREEIRKDSIDVLVRALRSDMHRQMKEAVLDELSQRDGVASLDALRDCVRYLEERAQASSGPDPRLRMLAAKAKVAMLKREAGRDEGGFLSKLEPLLEAEDGLVVDAVCAELASMRSPLVVEALRRHEAKGKPIIKITGLRIEYGALPKDQFVVAVLRSARATILESEEPPLLVAERTVLMYRDAVEGLASVVLAAMREASSRETTRSVAEQRYSAFLTSVYRDLPTVRETRDGQTPGTQESPDREATREPRPGTPAHD